MADTPKPTMRETLDAIYEAGGKVWDDIQDPEAFIRELRCHGDSRDALVARYQAALKDAERTVTRYNARIAELEAIVDKPDPSVQVLEDIKMALRMPGTGSYVAWAKKVRDDYETLSAVVDTLPETADGVVMFLNERYFVWADRGERFVSLRLIGLRLGEALFAINLTSNLLRSYSEIYSTLEAAEAARKGKEE